MRRVKDLSFLFSSSLYNIWGGTLRGVNAKRTLGFALSLWRYFATLLYEVIPNYKFRDIVRDKKLQFLILVIFCLLIGTFFAYFWWLIFGGAYFILGLLRYFFSLFGLVARAETKCFYDFMSHSKVSKCRWFDFKKQSLKICWNFLTMLYAPEERLRSTWQKKIYILVQV